jgi:hypothetical protein
VRRALAFALTLVSCQPAPPDAPVVARTEQAVNVTVPPLEYTGSQAQPQGGFGQVLVAFHAAQGDGFVVGAPNDYNGGGSFQVVSSVRPNGTYVEGLYRNGTGPNLSGANIGSAFAVADFNGDGLVDLAVGAPGFSVGGSPEEGAVLLYPGIADPNNLFDGNNSSTLLSNLPSAGARFGTSLTAVDWDGDKVPDLIVGAPGADEVFVFYGTGVGTDALLDPAAPAPFYPGGVALAVDDFDGQGLPELLTSQPDRDTSLPGSGFVYFITHYGQLLDQFGAVPPQPGARVGSAMVTLGPLISNGIGGVAIAADGWDAGVGDEGQVVLYLGANPVVLYGATLSWDGPPGSRFGAALANVGDLVGDGGEQLLVGAPGFSGPGAAGAGAAFVYPVVPLDVSGPSPLFRVPGPTQAGAQFGAAVAGGADLDGDGTPDYLVGAPGYAPSSGSQLGGVFIYLSSRGGSDAGTAMDAGVPVVDGGTLLPDGGVLLPDGGILLPDGGALLPDAGTLLPDGGTLLPDGGTLLPDGGTLLPDGGTLLPDGGTLLPDGGTLLPDGGTLLPDGGTPLPNYDFNTCGCHASGGGLFLLLVPMRRRARAGRGSSRTPAPRSSAPPRS